MSKKLLTFAGGNQDYINAGNRLVNQGKRINLFDETILYTDEYLKNDTYFWNKHGEFIEGNKRGYGYWLWKSYLINKTMKTMNDCDILLYVDCGCEIDMNKKDKMKEYFDIVKKDYIIGSNTLWVRNMHSEKIWNKMDLILHLDMLDNEEHLNSAQHEAGALLFYVCDKTRELVNKWYEISCNYHLINDSPSNNINLPCFCEHRHDQSIFSLLTKKYNMFSSYSIKECLEYERNISSKSRLVSGKTVIFTWTQNVSNLKKDKYQGNFWGLGDIIRGTISMYKLSKKYNFKLIIDIQHHPLSQFLKIKTHEYTTFIEENKNNIIFLYPGEVEKYILSNNDDLLFFFSNPHYSEPIDEDCKDFIKDILTPNEEFNQFFTQQILNIPYDPYTILHYRLGDKELVCSEIQNSYEDPYNHLKSNIQNNSILMSDSAGFKNYIKNNIELFMFESKTGHTGYHCDYELLRDTLFEFFVIMKSKKIISYSNYSWVSGFVTVAKSIYDVDIQSVNTSLLC